MVLHTSPVEHTAVAVRVHDTGFDNVGCADSAVLDYLLDDAEVAVKSSVLVDGEELAGNFGCSYHASYLFRVHCGGLFADNVVAVLHCKAGIARVVVV